MELLTLLLALLVYAAARSGSRRFSLLLDDPFLTHRGEQLRPLGDAFALTGRISLFLAGAIALQLAWTLLAPRPVVVVAESRVAPPPACPPAAPSAAVSAPMVEAPAPPPAPVVTPVAVPVPEVRPQTPVKMPARASRRKSAHPAAAAAQPSDGDQPVDTAPVAPAATANDSEPDDTAAAPH